MGCWLNSVQQLNTQKHIKIGEILLKHFVLIKVLDEMYQHIFTRNVFLSGLHNQVKLLIRKAFNEGLKKWNCISFLLLS